MAYLFIALLLAAGFGILLCIGEGFFNLLEKFCPPFASWYDKKIGYPIDYEDDDGDIVYLYEDDDGNIVYLYEDADGDIVYLYEDDDHE